MDRETFAEKLNRWQARSFEELYQAPECFEEAFDHLCRGDNATAEELFSGCVSDEGPWSLTALAVIAFLKKERKDYESAIESANTCKKSGLTLNGHYYYFDALSDALNQTDRLLECLNINNEAIEYFAKQDSPANLANYFFKKANVLKQMAAPLSHSVDDNSSTRAKELIVEAVRSICESLMLTSEGWEYSCLEELQPITNIAARTGVTRLDLPFLDSMDDIRMISDQYFSAHSLASRGLGACSNMAHSRVESNDRHEAAFWFDKGLRVAPTEDPWDRAFTAQVAYQAGVNLLILHGLENSPKAATHSPDISKAVDSIRRYWKQTLDIYLELDSETIAKFNKEFPPGLTMAAWNIKRDALMSRV